MLTHPLENHQFHGLECIQKEVLPYWNLLNVLNSVQTPEKMKPKTNSTWTGPVDFLLESTPVAYRCHPYKHVLLYSSLRISRFPAIFRRRSYARQKIFVANY